MYVKIFYRLIECQNQYANANGLTAADASLRFSLEILSHSFYQNAKITIEEALIGSIDVSRVAKRQWTFFSTCRHPSVVQTLQNFIVRRKNSFQNHLEILEFTTSEITASFFSLFSYPAGLVDIIG
jgi:hypothetical protein